MPGQYLIATGVVLLNRLLRFGLWAWSRLPLRLVHALGAFLGWIVWIASPSYRAKFQRVANTAGVSASDQRKAVSESGRWATECIWIWGRTIPEVSAKVQWGDRRILDQAMAQQRGVIILTPHLGCYESAGRAFSLTHPVTALYKPPKQAWLAQALDDQRATTNLSTAPTNLAGVKQLMRVLKGGGAIAILPDQVPGLGEGEWSNFFGQQAYTMTLPGRLSQTTGAPIVLVACERLPRGSGWRLHFRPMSSVPEGQTSQAINDAMQALILEFPTQYLWGYNRFRQPR
jgi:Kdo2-lipid IVA lauroyltransferase/acyltransferase